jgi:hypothetical protein
MPMGTWPGAIVSLMRVQLVVSGWRPGFAPIAFVHLLQGRAGLGLAEAKHAKDCLVAEGQAITLDFATHLEASEFRRTADLLGAVVEDAV